MIHEFKAILGYTVIPSEFKTQPGLYSKSLPHETNKEPYEKGKFWSIQLAT